ncbi:MAG: alpha/beta hydrolase [Bryobacteraceae bacterium]|nr:alpha/beta hydrolase [Bryobacteraceae bacterium]
MASAESARNVVFASPGGVSLTLDAFVPDSPGPHPAVILVHGGGWGKGDKQTDIQPWLPVLSQAGFAWFSINYRLAPAYRHPAAVEDVEAAIEFVITNASRYRVNPNLLALMGEGAGGHLAALAGVRVGASRIRAVVEFHGVNDIPLWLEQRKRLPKDIAQYLGIKDMSPASVEIARQASPVTYIARHMPHFLFIHGTADKIVPHRQSEQMCASMKQIGVPCEVFLIKDAPHGVANWEAKPRFQTWKPKLVEWLREGAQLGPPPLP